MRVSLDALMFFKSPRGLNPLGTGSKLCDVPAKIGQADGEALNAVFHHFEFNAYLSIVSSLF